MQIDYRIKLINSCDYYPLANSLTRNTVFTVLVFLRLYIAINELMGPKRYSINQSTFSNRIDFAADHEVFHRQ